MAILELLVLINHLNTMLKLARSGLGPNRGKVAVGGHRLLYAVRQTLVEAQRTVAHSIIAAATRSQRWDWKYNTVCKIEFPGQVERVEVRSMSTGVELIFGCGVRWHTKVVASLRSCQERRSMVSCSFPRAEIGRGWRASADQ